MKLSCENCGNSNFELYFKYVCKTISANSNIRIRCPSCEQEYMGIILQKVIKSDTLQDDLEEEII